MSIMVWRLLFFARALCSLIALMFVGEASVFARDVVIGVFAYQGERAATADWSPVLSYLNAALPVHRFRLDNLDAEGLHRAIF